MTSIDTFRNEVVEARSGRRGAVGSLRHGVVAGLLLLALCSCRSAPPFVGGSAPGPIFGGWFGNGSSASFERWGSPCGFRIDGAKLELRRGDTRLTLLGVVPPDGVLFRLPSADEEVSFDLGGGRLVVWDDRDVMVDDEEYEFGRVDEVSARPAREVFEARLEPGRTFARRRVWMSASGADLELHRGDRQIVLGGAVPEDGLRFTVEDFDLPRVRLELADGASALWVRDRVWIGDELVAAAR